MPLAPSRLAVLASASAVLLLTACSQSAGTSPSIPPSASGEGQGTALGALTFSSETFAQGQGTIDVAHGGTVTATATDGTRFTLEVPPGAVDRTMTVTVTPLTDTGGITDATRTMGVALGPDGSQFAVPLRLTIEPSTPVAVGQQLLFTSAGDGARLQPAVVDPAVPEAVALLSHFSTAGLAELPAEADAALLHDQATSTANDLAARLAAVSQVARQAQLEGDASTGLDLAGFLEEYRTGVVDPLLAGAGSSCSAAKEAIDAVTQYDRQRQLLGIDSAPTLPLDQLISLDQGACEKEAIEKCQEAEDPGILVDLWLSQDRQRELIGQDALHDLSTIEQDARNMCSPASGFSVSPDTSDFGDGPAALGSPGGIYGDVCHPDAVFTLSDNPGNAQGTATFTPDETGQSGTVDWVFDSGIVKETASGTYALEWDGTAGTMHLDVTGHFDWVAPGSSKPSGPMKGEADFALVPLEAGGCE